MPILQRLAGQSSEFQVRTTGLGIFGGLQPVVFIPVVRSSELTRFHQALWQAISQAGSGIVDYYHPDQWVPHITLAHGDLDLGNLPDVVHFLSERSFNWEILVDNIALIYDAGTEQELEIRYEFGTLLTTTGAAGGDPSGR
jgi:2'-5' RNA ligase